MIGLQKKNRKERYKKKKEKFFLFFWKGKNYKRKSDWLSSKRENARSVVFG